MTIFQNNINQQLQSAGIHINFSELHGFLSGLICGGISEQNWQPLLYQFTNDNHAYPTALLTQVSQLYQQIAAEFADLERFAFELCLTEDENIFARAESLCEWANHFLLGLGLAQPHLDKEKGEIGEAVDDLHDICHLGYDESDDKEEMSEALEEIIEYVRTIATLFYTQFNQRKMEAKPTLH